MYINNINIKDFDIFYDECKNTIMLILTKLDDYLIQTEFDASDDSVIESILKNLNDINSLEKNNATTIAVNDYGVSMPLSKAAEFHATFIEILLKRDFKIGESPINHIYH